MADFAVIVLRLVQYAAAAALMGAPLFFLYALPAEPFDSAPVPGGRPLVATGALALAIAAGAGLAAQTAVMAGSLADAFRAESIGIVAGLTLGKAALVRVACGLVAAALLAVVRSPGRRIWAAIAAFGTVATASFAWSGHGATTEGGGFWVHLTFDVLHGWAAAAWIGALLVFAVLLRDRGQTPGELVQAHRALSRFSTAGTIFVVTLLATGLINGWYLVGLHNIAALATSLYGELLLLKIAVFAGMIGLAASNRFRLTPRLGSHLGTGSSLPPSLRELRRSIAVETGFGLTALALVSWFGTLEPPMAM